ncbi:MAG: hypothetical protein SPL73_06380 [Cyanobacteriota bacterium]|nr:hypothetical protein [Cyanobacteriota bacterium]MDY6359176.1 hypothetical protein [Cyanobacteriota bacterium]MDY6364497.1 hypothetical protein [Cyanobacteriota bacterium]MDY6383141.1 hypothetical protein [Cyanobacteriota bacterium]
MTTFNPLKEKGLPLEKQVRTWHDIAHRKYNKNDIDCYSRTRQILMNGIEIEEWNFKHNFSRVCQDEDTLEFLAQTKRIEDAQQSTINWLAPADQSVLETTLAYEQVAVDLTAWMAQNETDNYVKETFDFGLLEDFDHLYRYSQWAYMIHGISPNEILQNQTDVILGRPTQNHHNCNIIRLRKPYDKTTTSPQTKVNILTLVSGEQQTHNYYGEHGFAYGSELLRETYAEIKDVEEEHVTMYESLIDPSESFYEKLLLHEFTEVCTYHNCMEDEENETLMPIWEEFLAIELNHLQTAAKLYEKYEKKDPQELIGENVVHPCHFTSQKDYVTKVLKKEIDKRLGTNKNYAKTKDLPDDWASYNIQELAGKEGAPSEVTIRVMEEQKGRDLVCASKELQGSLPELVKKAMQTKGMTKDTVTPEEYQKMSEKEFVM